MTIRKWASALRNGEIKVQLRLGLYSLMRATSPCLSETARYGPVRRGGVGPGLALRGQSGDPIGCLRQFPEPSIPSREIESVSIE